VGLAVTFFASVLDGFAANGFLSRWVETIEQWS